MESLFLGDVDVVRQLFDLIKSFFPPLIRQHLSRVGRPFECDVSSLLALEFLGHLQKRKADPPSPVMCLH